MFRYRFAAACGVLALIFALAAPASAEPPATPPPGFTAAAVDAGHILRRVNRKLLGIDVDYLLDADVNRRPGARKLARAILDLGAGTLRYPGGEKSDGMLWAAPPAFRRPGPTLARLGPDEWPSNDARVYDLYGHRYVRKPLDFDAFIRLCRQTGAEPVVVVAYDSMYRPGSPGETVPDKATLLKNAVSWVRYANIERHYGVKYWEIGNESYFYVYNGGAKAADYARDLPVFAAAMKGVDPTIKIGANGPSGADDVGSLDNLSGITTPWWQAVFGLAAGSIDFVSVHEYPCYAWYGYDYYRDSPVRMLGVSEIDKAARHYGPPGLADRLRYLLTETNSADWYGHPQNLGWKHENTLGHALVLFDMLAQAISDPRVVTAQIWTTRWLNNDTAPELWDALDSRNRPLPTGLALKLLARNLGTALVATTDGDKVRVVATRNDQTRQLTVFLLNKDTTRDIVLHLDGGRPGRTAARQVWSGSGPDDKRPVLRAEAPVAIAKGQARLTLPPVSLTVLTVPFRPDDIGRLRAQRTRWRRAAPSARSRGAAPGLGRRGSASPAPLRRGA
ncbi:alpha-L-arabinofuranosidase [Desulfovibrio sp. JY]|nr:alpha-L-arabinofuranosidase [Desulfovibrio sp. JY]